MSQQFPKISRLLNAKDYSDVFSKPSFRVSNRYFLILSLNTKYPTSRLGVVVAKKNVAKAVQRNRIKRLIRESFRTRTEDLGTIDLVILVRKGINLLENNEIRRLIRSLFKEISLQESAR